MIYRRILLTIAKYVAILLCFITVLLTTPWGSHFTIVVLNNFDGVTIDYKSGSLIRDIELNAFDLRLDNIDIAIKSLSTEVDFSCVWKKTLCINSLKASYLSFHYLSNEEAIEQLSEKKLIAQPLVMPFAIKADLIELNQSNIVINGTEIAANSVNTGLAINDSEFKLLKPSLKQLTVTVAASETKVQQTTQPITTSITTTLAELPQVNLPISLIIQQLSINEVIVTEKNCQELNCEYWRSSNNSLSATWVNSDVNIRHFQTFTPDLSITQLQAKAKLTPPYQLNTQFVNEVKAVTWWPEIANTTQQVSLQGSLANLTFDITSENSLVFDTQGSINLIDADMPFNITLAATKIPMPLSLSQYGEPSSLFLVLSGDLNKQIIELSSELNSYGYNNAQLALVGSHHQGRFNIKELLFEDQSTTSHVNLNGELAVLPEEVTWQLAVKSTGFSVPQLSLQALTDLGKSQTQVNTMLDNLPDIITGRLQGEIASTGMWSTKQWQASVNNTHIVGKVNDKDLIIKGNIGINQMGHFKPGQLFLAFNESELTLQANNTAYWDLKGTLLVSNISQWYQAVDGDIKSDFSVSGEKHNPVITLNGQVSQFNWQQWQGNTLDIQGEYQPMQGHQVDLSVKNNQLMALADDNAFTIDDFVFKLSGNADKHQITSQWLGDTTGNVTIIGHLNKSLTDWKATVEESQLGYQKSLLHNDKHFDINVDLITQQGVVEEHCWQSEGVSVCLPNQAALGAVGDIALKLNIDLSVVDELFFPNDIELVSTLQGDINATWSAQKPIDANAQFSLSPGFVKVTDDFEEYQLTQWSQGDFTFTLKDEKLTSIMKLMDRQDNALMYVNSTIGFNGDYPVEAKINLNQFNLQPFRDVLSDVVNLQGSLNANLLVKGTLGAPLLNGDIALNKGKLRLRQSPNTLDNIETTIAVNNNQAELLGNFFIEDKQAHFSGEMGWQRALSLNLDFNAESLPLIFPPQLAFNIAPNLTISLIDKSITITGDIDVLDGEYKLESLPEGSVSFSDDVVIINEQGQTIAKETSGFDIKTNIRVNIANAFKISGQGLQSRLLGQLQINQHEKQPFQLFGSVQSYEGTFEAYGQKLKIEKGEVIFSGPMDNPYFNLRASRYINAEDIDVGIQITGLVDALEMQLFSSPTMERPEMLSYLVRGRGLDASTDNNAALVGLLVGYGISSSTALFAYLEKVPLINNIVVDTEGDGDKTQATISGYVGDRVYLKYGVGVYEPINELTVKMFLWNRFWLEIVSGIEKSTDFYYSFDID